MKKNMIALLLSIVMTVGSIGSTPAFAAETTTEEAVAVEEETADEVEDVTSEAEYVETEEIAEDLYNGESVEVIEEDSLQDVTESADEAETTEKTEAIVEALEADSADIADTSAEVAEVEEPAGDAEEVETEDESKDAALAEEGDIVDSGECGENATWKLTEETNELKLTISGAGVIDKTNDLDPWSQYNDKITSVVIENGISEIGYSVFQDMDSLITVVMGDTIEYIGSGAFWGCDSLQDVNLSESLISIGGGAFDYCVRLSSIALPDSLLSLGGCFSASGLREIFIPANVKSLNQNSFYNCSSLVAIYVDDNNATYEDINGVLINKKTKTLIKYPEAAQMTEYTIPSNVEIIGVEAFRNSQNIVELHVPRSVMSADEYSFSNMKSLKTVIIEEGLTSLGRNSFETCNELENVTLPSSLTSLPRQCFIECYKLNSIVLPETLTEIGYETFRSCRRLVDIQIPSSVHTIDYGAFHETGVKNVVLPRSVEYVGTYAFFTEKLLKITILNPHCSLDTNFISSLTSMVGPQNSSAQQYALDNGIEFERYICKDHTWIDSIQFEATCIEDGSKEKVCVVCGEKVTVTLPATGRHAYGDWTVTKEATCTEAGSREKVCANCGDKITGAIPAKGHSYGGWTETKEPTCTVAGSMEKICANCGDKVIEAIPAKGHTWNDKYTTDKKPTYTEEGVESIHCYVCRMIKEGSKRAIPKLQKSIELLKISGIVDKTYTGNAQIQSIVVKDGDYVLEKGTDYEVDYFDNINVGVASVYIRGLGNYWYFVKHTFTIKKAPNTITAKNFTRTYSTNAQTFDLGVKIKNGTPTYKSNSKSVTVSKAGKVTVKAKFIGKATITITAPEKTNYSKQTKKITITVNPTKTALSSVTSPSAGKMTVKWKKNAVGTGYQIQYSTSSKFTSPKAVSVTKNTTLTKTIGSLAKGKKYYVRIRTYKTVGSTKFYSGWSAAKTVTIKK